MKNCWDRKTGTVTNLLNELDWPSLQDRRKESRPALLHKVIHGEVDMGLPVYVERKKRQLRPNHPEKFIELQHNTEAYRNSFYCKTIRDWNLLPNHLLEIDNSGSFRGTVSRNI